jgi:multiple antibiotic resistance protein
MMDQVLLAFIPMFFAMDPLGILAIFAGLTQGFTPAQKRSIIVQSLLTATLVAVSFIFLGKAIFSFLGITMGDFMIAGGVILFCLSMVDLLGQESPTREIKNVEIGAVPIGTPLIVGPAVLTMALMLTSQFGSGMALISVMANIAIVAVVFLFSDTLLGLLGTSGSRALSKVMALLLAAIGIMMIRKGIIEIISVSK